MAKSILIADLESLIQRAFMKHAERIVQEIKTAAGNGHASDFISSHEFLDALRSAFNQRDVVDLAFAARELEHLGGNKASESEEEKHKRFRLEQGLTNRARKVLGSFTIELFKPVIEGLNKSIDGLKTELAETRTAVQKHHLAVDNLTRQQRIEDLIEDGPLKKRFVKEFPEEKELIVEFLANRVFIEKEKGIRCFLQASTTILRLAGYLRERGLPSRSLIHTNSTLFPYLMLGKKPEFQIYTICGKQHDEKCCGWLFDRNDSHAADYVRGLFDRSPDKLDLAIITPQYMTANGHLSFARADTKYLVEILLEGADHVIVLSPAPRIYSSEECLPSGEQFDWESTTLKPRRTNQKFELVVGGKFDNLPGGKDDLALLARNINADCHYRPDRDAEWTSLSTLAAQPPIAPIAPPLILR